MDTPATEPSTISTMLGGTVSAIAAPVASSATISPGLWPRRFISGNSAGATVAMSDTLDPEMPDTMNSEPSSTYDMPAFTWPTSEREEVDDGLAHAGGVQHAAQQHEHRHGHQDEAGHALVHAADDDHQRHLRRECEVARRAEAEAERDRHAGGQAHTHEADEEDGDVHHADRAQLRRQAPAQRPHGHHRDSGCRSAATAFTGAARRPARSPASSRCRTGWPRRGKCSGCSAWAW